MCGISGIAAPQGKYAQPELVGRMMSILKHRGPSSASVVASATGEVAFGMRTLAIVSPGIEFGPFTDPTTGVIVTYNGEIYGYRGVAERLGVDIEPADTDGDFVLKAYLRLGTAFLSDVDGMFAIAIYDPRHAVTFLIRDGVGQKPLYYRRVGKHLHFASEIKALVDGWDVPIDVPTSVISLETPVGTATPYAHVHLLEPGCLLRYDHRSGSTRVSRHWDITWAEKRSETDWVGAYADALAHSVEEQRYGGDHALLLSGGLDSGVLAYLMRPAVCYTVRSQFPQRDESGRAAAISRGIGADLVTIEPLPEDFRRVAFELVAALEYPVGNASLLPEYLCYEAIATSGIRVVCGGVGPDEHLLGYVRHMLALFGGEAVMREGLTSYAPLARRLDTESTRDDSTADRYLKLVLRGADSTGEVQNLIRRYFLHSGQRADRALTLTDQALSMPPLLLTADKLASAFSLKRRSPYLSKEIMGISFAAPSEWRIRSPRETKSLLRSAARRLGVPDWVITTEYSKQGFASSVPGWLNSELREWCDEWLEAALATDPPPVLAALFTRARTMSPAARYERTRTMGLLWALWWSARVRPKSAQAAELRTQGVA